MTSLEIIIVAAGSGLRYGAPLPKQYCDLGGRPVLMHTIDALRAAAPDAKLTLVISREMTQLWQDLCNRHNFTSPDIVFGGATRWESVCNALKSSVGIADIIMVHDAVRPLVSKEIIDRLVKAISSDTGVDGAIPAIAVTDSLRSISDDGHSKSIDRSTMRAVQTPQAFRGDRLHSAYDLPYRDSFTDDASVMEAAGYCNLVLTKGSSSNIKITNPGDIAIAETLMKLNSLS